ncbi:ABC-F family ATP-binding cassette domain-containing protein [Candidatus Kapaibacterium sp.]
MITLNNLSVHFGGRHLFDDISMMIGTKDKIGLIGRNGTGKSTLLKIIARIDEPSSGSINTPNDFKIGYLPQEIEVNSELTVFEETETALTEIQYLEKELDSLNNYISESTDYDSNEYLRAIEKLTHYTERLKILGAESKDGDIEKVLLGLGFLRSDFTRKVREFSGGWQMRIELAKILLSQPNCILLDEPTNHLDIESVRWLENFLKNYYGIIILVSHDRRFLDNVTNRTLEISLGKIYDMNCNYSEFIKKRAEQRELQTAAYKNQQKQIEQTEKFIERFRSKATLASRVQSRVKQLEKIERIELEDVDSSSINLKFPEPPRSARLQVEMDKLSKSYGSLMVLDSINFALERGEKIAFVGRNGEGKSTLSRIIAGLESYDGEMKIADTLIIGYYAQHQSTLFNPDLSVFDVIDSEASGEVRPYIRSILGAFMFSGDSVYKKIKVLSGGEKSRLSLARLMLRPANLLILDEPTNHLDMAAKDVLKKALMEFTGSLIVVSHDREFLEGLTNKTLEFKNNKIKEFLGDIDYYLEKTQIENLQELEIKDRHNTNESSDKSSKSQNDRDLRKSLQRELNKSEKEHSKIEMEIELMEAEISRLDELFSDSDFYKNALELSQKQERYKLLKDELEVKYQLWDDLSNKILDLKEELRA